MASATKESASQFHAPAPSCGSRLRKGTPNPRAEGDACPNINLPAIPHPRAPTMGLSAHCCSPGVSAVTTCEALLPWSSVGDTHADGGGTRPAFSLGALAAVRGPACCPEGGGHRQAAARGRVWG